MGLTGAAFADSDRVEELNELLRGEISAVETYNQAIEKFGSSTSASFLREARDDHKANVEDIRKKVLNLGGKPSEGSGAWGVWAEAVVGGAKVFGEKSALMALKQGEEHGVNEYQEMLTDNDVSAEMKKDIKDEYLPKQVEHLSKLTALIEQLK